MARRQGNRLSPEPVGIEENPYYETIRFEAAGDVTNAEVQTLAIVGYHQVVTRKSDGEVFHGQIGYWTWDPATRTIAQSVNIPRVVSVLAGGSFEADADACVIVLEVKAKKADPDWGIIESPFMRDTASTLAFEHRVEVSGDYDVPGDDVAREIRATLRSHRHERTDPDIALMPMGSIQGALY